MHAKSNKWDSSHRPLPLPKLPWAMRQSWNNLLFIHYKISLSELRKFVPEQLPLDSYDGWGWISVVPFQMDNVGLRGIPLSLSFPELNVRTYVTIDNKPGIYFFSLDATHLLFVKLSNMLLNLPYIHSHMKLEQEANISIFELQRKDQTLINLECSYRPISDPYFTVSGTLDYWLTERYCFYNLNKRGQIRRCDILHEPWPIQKVEVDIKTNTILKQFPGKLLTNELLFHYSKGVDVRVWPLVRVKI